MDGVPRGAARTDGCSRRTGREPDGPGRAGHQGDAGRWSSSTSTAPAPPTVSTGVPFFDHMLAQLGKHGCLDLTVAGQGRHRDRRAPHRRGHRASRSGQALRRGAGRQGRHLPVRRRARPAGRDAGAGRRRPVRPAVRGARRAGRHGAADRQLRHHADPAHLRVARRVAAGICLHVRVLDRAATRTTSSRPSSRRSPGRCARRRRRTRGPAASRAPRASCERAAAAAASWCSTTARATCARRSGRWQRAGARRRR